MNWFDKLLGRKPSEEEPQTVPPTVDPETSLPDLTPTERAELFTFVDDHNGTLPYSKLKK